MNIVDTKTLRIALFGGGFDPVHYAHEMMVKVALSELALDLLYIVPTGHAWHKQRPLSDAAHRLNMLSLVFKGKTRVCIDSVEIKNNTPSYSIDTLTFLQKRHPQAKFYLIIGQDQYENFKFWYRFQDILNLVTLCVAQRPAAATTDIFSMPQRGSQSFSEASIAFTPLIFDAVPVSSTQIRQAICNSYASVHELQQFYRAISSNEQAQQAAANKRQNAHFITMIRPVLVQHYPVLRYVQNDVLAYIYRHHLYR